MVWKNCGYFVPVSVSLQRLENPDIVHTRVLENFYTETFFWIVECRIP